MGYKITATVTSRKQKGFEHVRCFWSEVQPTKAELRLLEKRLKRAESGRPEDFDVWIDIKPVQTRTPVPILKLFIEGV